MIGKQTAKLAEMTRYCVLCRKEYGPHLKGCCTHNSVVAIRREGFLRKRIRYFTLDGRQVDESGLSAIREIAIATRDSGDLEPREQPGDPAAEESIAAPTDSLAKSPVRHHPKATEPDMVSRAWLLGVILAVPLIGFAVAEAIQVHFNSELRAVLRRQLPGADAAAISSMTIDRICQNPNAELLDLCGTNANLNLMSTAALGAGAAGTVLLLLIRLAGTAARGSRKLLLYVFKPGLYFTALALIGLIVVHAAVAMGAIYYGESALVNRIHIGVIAAIGLGAVAGVVGIARSAFALVQKARTFVIGTSVSRTEAPRLWTRVEQLAERLGALPPQNIVTGLVHRPINSLYYEPCGPHALCGGVSEACVGERPDILSSPQ